MSEHQTTKLTPREIADRIVPEYRKSKGTYSCYGTIAKRWDAAYRAAEMALKEVGHPSPAPRIK